MSVIGKERVQFYLSASVQKDVERYLSEHYPSLNVRSAFFEEAIKSYLDHAHTHTKSYLKEPWSRTERIILAIRDEDLHKEIPFLLLRRTITKTVGEDPRTLSKYMGEWDEIRVTYPDDPSEVMIRYIRHAQKRGEKKKPPIGLLFERGFLNEGIIDDGLRGISRFGINWEAVDLSLRPKSLKEGN